MSKPSKVHVVLVHGAWHNASTWDSLRQHLDKAGFPNSAINLPSVGGKGDPHPDHSQDVATIRAEYERVINEGRDVIAIFHSYGGQPGSEACQGLSKAERTAQGKKGGIIHTIYRASMMLKPGQSVTGNAMEAFKAAGRMPKFKGVNLELVPGWLWMTDDDAARSMYSEMDREAAMPYVREMAPQSPGPLMAPLGYAPWMNGMPTTYVLAELDEVVEPWLQEKMVEAKEFKGKVVRVKAQHCFYATHQEEIVEVVKEAAKSSAA